MRTPKIGTIKYIYRDGDVRSDYPIGENVTFKWHRRWRIIKTELQYVSTAVLASHYRTMIKLEKVSDK